MPPAMGVGSRRDTEEDSVLLVTKACDVCRKKKIRCEPVSGTCEQCIKYKTECHFTPISVTRRPRRPTRDKRVEVLEERLKWTEGQLKRALEGQHARRDMEPTFQATGVETPNSNHSRADTGHISLTVSEHNSVNAISPIGGVSNSTLEIPEALKHESFLGRQPTLHHENLEPISNAFTRRTFKPLPSKDKAFNLITASFQGFNTAYPIFDQAIFMSKFDALYTLDIKSNNPSWWACLNIVLALTYQFRAKESQDMEEDREAWEYFQNALSVTNQLMTMQPTLESVQALLGMSIAILGTPHQGPVALLTSTAIRLAQKLDLHRQCRDPRLSTAEIEERKQVFWVAYSLDKSISLQTGQPPTQSDEDMDVELPSECCHVVTQPNETGVTLFYFRSRLAIIQGQIYKHLLSVKASKQSADERAIAARELELELQTWRATVPMELFRDYWGPTMDGPPLDTSRHPVFLQLSYFQSLSVIRESLPILPWYQEMPTSRDEVRLQVLSAPVTYTTEARNAIKLLNVTPRRKFACVWSVLHIFITAATTLLTHIISNPSNPLAQADLKLLEPLLTLLGILERGSKNEKVAEMYQSSMGLFEKATVAVQDCNAEDIWNQGNTGRESNQKETVEEFLRRMEMIKSGYGEDIDMTYPGDSDEFEGMYQLD